MARKNGRKYELAKNITYEECKKFVEEHAISRTYVKDHYFAYYSAMKRLGCLDEFYPWRIKKHTIENALIEAKKYHTKKDLWAHAEWAAKLIYDNGLEDEAYKDYEELHSNAKRMIYAFEFEETKSVYVGLTYKIERRKEQHLLEDETSAVYKYIQESGITPVIKELTDYIDYKEASKEEGKWVEKYKQEGWTILNKAKTGGLGMVRKFNGLEEKISKLNKEGKSLVDIAKILNVSLSTVKDRVKYISDYITYKHIPKGIKVTIIKGDEVTKYKSISEASKALHFDRPKMYRWMDENHTIRL